MNSVIQSLCSLPFYPTEGFSAWTLVEPLGTSHEKGEYEAKGNPRQAQKASGTKSFTDLTRSSPGGVGEDPPEATLSP